MSEDAGKPRLTLSCQAPRTLKEKRSHYVRYNRGSVLADSLPWMMFTHPTTDRASRYWSASAST
jgi:hypothetical protein